MSNNHSNNFEEYHKALNDRVCSICRKSGYGDSCAIGEGGNCPIDTHLPRLVNAVLSAARAVRRETERNSGRALNHSHQNERKSRL